MNSKTTTCTEFLFARPTFWSGAARVLDLGGTFDQYNSSRTGDEADARALSNDWIVVGETMRDAIETVTSESR